LSTEAKIEWTTLTGDNKSDFFRGVPIAVNNEGYVYIAGTTTKDLNGIKNNGDCDISLIKLNNNKSQEFTKLIGSNKNEFATDICIGSDGSIYISGHTEGDLNGQINKGYNDPFLIKLNSNGIEEWTKLFGSNKSDGMYTIGGGLIKSSNDGYIYFLGERNDMYFISKFDSNGNETQIFSGHLSKNGIFDPYYKQGYVEDWSIGLDGSFYITGSTGVNLDGQANNGVEDVFITKINKNGNKEWTKLFGGNAYDNGFGICLGDDGSIYLAGKSNSTYLNGQLNPQITNLGSAFVMKLKADGKEEWTKLIATDSKNSPIEAKGIYINKDESIYITGYTQGDLNNQSSKGASDVFAMKMLADGTEEWTKLFATSARDYAYEISISNEGFIYITGETSGNLNGEMGSGYYDDFVIKLSEEGLTVEKGKEIIGTSQDDSLQGDTGNNTVNGKDGEDTYILTGLFSNYSFTRNTSSLTVSDQRTGTNDGTDTLSNIEYIQFSDQKVEESKVDVVKTYSGNFSDYKFYNKGNGIYHIKTDVGYDDITGFPLLTFTEEAATSSFRDVSAIVDIKGTFDQVTGLKTDSGEMFRLYNAAFARFPDADGLKYWIEEFSSGRNTRRVVAKSFLASAEFAERYGSNVSNEKYVETLYTNILGRDYDQGGYNYWLGNLNSGLETRYELLLGFAENAENLALFTEMTGLE